MTKKEVVTHERILQDYNNKMRSFLKPVITLFVVILCLSIPAVYASFSNFNFSSFLLIGEIALLAFLCIAALVKEIKEYQNIENGCFSVVTDELIRKQEQERYYTRFLSTFSKSAKLEFYAYGTYTPDANYTSHTSDRFAVSDVDNYFTSSVGDKFFLVINKKSHILLVYNTKLFEYHE